MNYSPLRYPGGKSRIAPMVQEFIDACPTKISTYYEPFCGGAGVALYLLINNVVEFVAINDYDRAIYSFWRAVLTETDKLINKIEDTPVTISEWKKQREIYNNSTKYSLEYAFATLYLNRTNRSGILKAGPIGGYQQEGYWKLDARYNKYSIINKISNISKLKNRIKLNNMDIRRYINTRKFDQTSFIYFDPPYVNNANRLYKNSLTIEDHATIAESIKNIKKGNWMLTYDNTKLIHLLYKEYYITNYSIQYSVANKRKETELLILKDKTMSKETI